MPVEVIKRIFLGQGIVEPAYVAMSSVMALVLLLSGVVVFNKVEKTFVDTV
jgi:lipopolysaccharide transport system permease protein